MRRAFLLGLTVLGLFGACARRPEPAAPPPGPQPIVLPPPLPDSGGWGVPVLAIAPAVEGVIYAGTHGHGVYRFQPGDSTWTPVPLGADRAAAVTALAATGDTLWYGTAGHGWGTVRPDSGEPVAPARGVDGWAWVALNGVAQAGGRVVIGTAAGVRITEDGGASWRCAVAEGESVGRAAECADVVATLPSSHVLAVHGDESGGIWIGHLAGVSVSDDGGRTWRSPDAASSLPRVRVRGIATRGDRVWLATESHLYEGSAATLRFQPAGASVIGNDGDGMPGSIRALIAAPGRLWPAVATSEGLFAPSPSGTPVYRHYRSNQRGGGDVWGALWWTRPYSPFAATSTGLDSYLRAHPMRQPLNSPSCRLRWSEDDTGAERAKDCATPGDAAVAAVPRHTLLQRPIRGADGNPYENPLLPPGLHGGALTFHTPPGTTVRAVAGGVVDHTAAGVMLRTDVTVRGAVVLAVYAGVEPAVPAGQRVRAGEIVGRVVQPADGAAALRLHTRLAAPDDAASADTLRVNPALMLRPVDGTGILAVRALQRGEPAAGVVLHGLVMAQPAEAPFRQAISYDGELAGHPAYGENLTVAGVPEGMYLIAVEAGGSRAWQYVRMRSGQITFAEIQLPNVTVGAASETR